MSYNWNVYKLFKNGRRAKAPILDFAFDGEEVEALNFFHAEVKEKFSEKNRAMEYLILRADAPQERAQEEEDLEKEQNLRNRSVVLGRLIRDFNIDHKRKIVGALMMTQETEWMWQWCAAEAGTHQYIGGLSQKFVDYAEALTWIQSQVKDLR